MESNTRSAQVDKLLHASATLAPFLDDIFKAAQKSADTQDPETAAAILDTGQAVLLELKKLELVLDIMEDR